MKKPSRKVTSVMILLGAFAIALISKDALENRALAKKNNPGVGTIESVEVSKSSKNLSLGEYISAKFEIAKKETEEPNKLTPKTITESMLTELYSRYNNLKESSLNSSENIESLTLNLSKQTKDFANIPNKYSFIDLKTFPDYQKDKIKKYGNEFAVINNKYYKQQFFIENKGDDMKYIEDYANIQIKFGDELASIETPRSISDEHLEFSNNMIKIGTAIIRIASIENDPLLSAAVLNQYNETKVRQSEISRTISEYFKKNDIIFSENEAGFVWNNF